MVAVPLNRYLQICSQSLDMWIQQQQIHNHHPHHRRLLRRHHRHPRCQGARSIGSR